MPPIGRRRSVVVIRAIGIVLGHRIRTMPGVIIVVVIGIVIVNHYGVTTTMTMITTMITVVVIIIIMTLAYEQHTLLVKSLLLKLLYLF